mgnify:CR=1 FL=1
MSAALVADKYFFAKYIDAKPSLALGLIARAVYPSTSPHHFSYSNKKTFNIFKGIVELLFPGITVQNHKEY